VIILSVPALCFWYG